MVILVSKCLMGENCRYKGDNCRNERILELAKKHTLIGVCPEVMGGLPTPRAPGERVGDKVIANTGADVTAEYELGALKALEIAKESGVELCVFKAKSPSCGCGIIYDGSFTGKLIPGDGVTVELFKKHGYKVITEVDVENGYFKKL
ncbi:MAG: DUF523 domain-containing protein [Clostridia bacterium]|nr:DUF523 domain-containing protein [Clostridia bacterium]